ncbi:MAG: ribonuclease H-like domain-containing protein [Clostridiaceae bacterium]|nr:ribonuclease H-like domain-containing protein [Clostridiaceae bacterium]
MKTIISPIPAPTHTYTPISENPEIAFFDIETTGLSPNASSLYLIGMMYFDSANHQWQLCQWFADNYQSEKEILSCFFEKLEQFSILIHFNGRTFDIPYVLKKCKRHAISLTEHCQKLLSDDSGIYSIDLLAKIRPMKQLLLLDKCSQTALECYLGIQRNDPFSGGELISVYSEYMQQKILQPQNAAMLEKTLLLHNREDVAKMLELCSLLSYSEYFSAHCTDRLLTENFLNSLSINDSQTHPVEKNIRMLRLTLELPDAVPKKASLQLPFPIKEASFPPLSLSVTLQEQQAVFEFPVYHGTLKYFFSDYTNYFYLPDEDVAIHKSVAAFMDSARRKKATAATCYTKKEGQFIPLIPIRKKTEQVCIPEIKTARHPFFCSYKEKTAFWELPDDYPVNTGFWRSYLANLLPNIC